MVPAWLDCVGDYIMATKLNQISNIRFSDQIKQSKPWYCKYSGYIWWAVAIAAVVLSQQ